MLARLPAPGTARPALWLPRPRARAPEWGQRCNPAKLLLDPYARAIKGQVQWDEAAFSYYFGDGAKGPTDDPEVNALRARQQRNFLATLFLSQGVPMLLGGDEISRTQGGNNNAYCQGNEISWYDWQAADWDLFAFVAGLIRLRQAHPVFRRWRFFLGRAIHDTGVGDIGWFRPDGQAMSEEDWQAGYAKSLAVYLNGERLHELDVRGQRLTDSSFYLVFNAHYESLTFTIPQGLGALWVKALDTHEGPPKHAQLPTDLGVPIPANEAQRLQDLYHYQVLDTEPESTFDDLTQLAAQICRTPMAAVSFIDATRQWLKAKLGLTMPATRCRWRRAQWSCCAWCSDLRGRDRCVPLTALWAVGPQSFASPLSGTPETRPANLEARRAVGGGGPGMPGSPAKAYRPSPSTWGHSSGLSARRRDGGGENDC